MNLRKKSDKPFAQLGKGLDALLGTEEQNPQILPLNSICLPHSQPRRYFDPVKLEQLQKSIEQYGVLEPLLVRPLDSHQYELVAGERRYRAASSAGLTEVPVSIRELNDSEALQIALIENLNREDLNPIEETLGVLQLLALLLNTDVEQVKSLLYQMKNRTEKGEDSFRHNVIPNSQMQLVEETFSTLGLMGWRSFIQNRLPLLKLPPVILESLEQGKIAYTKARVLARIKDNFLQKKLLEQAIEKNLSLSQIKNLIEVHQVQVEDPCPSNAPPTEEEKVEKRTTSLLRALQKTQLWKNPRKKKKLEHLLSEMEALLAEED